MTNIQTLLAKREAEERQAGLSRRSPIPSFVSPAACRLSICTWQFLALGSPLNLGWTGLRPFDPSFVILAMVASVEAIFLSTFVLISQKRLSGSAERRADFDLQISLWVEHEVTRLLLKFTRAMAERTGIDFPDDPEIRELEQNVEPCRVLDTLERASKLKGNLTERPYLRKSN